MINRIDRYLTAELLAGIVPVLLILLGLFGFLTLAEELEEVGNGAYEELDALRVTMLRLPRLAIEVLPVAALLGGVVALGNLANQRELLMLRGAGCTAWRVARPLAMTGVALGLTVYALQSFAVPWLEREATQIRAQTLTTTKSAGGSSEIWTRTGNRLLRVGEVTYGTQLNDIEIYELDARGGLLGLIEASRADLLDTETWLLHDVERTVLRGSKVTRVREERMRWESPLSADQLSALLIPVEAMSTADLRRYIDHLDLNELSSHRYRLVFWQQLSAPLALVGMCCLGLPFVLGPIRARPVGGRIVWGAGIGVAFYLAERTLGQLAVLYELNPATVALLPDTAIVATALVMLARVR